MSDNSSRDQMPGSLAKASNVPPLRVGDVLFVFRISNMFIFPHG